MPNYCYYDMAVRGKDENVDEFIKVMQSNYDYYSIKFGFDRHMGGRVFEADVIYYDRSSDGRKEAYIHGYCAWSVSSCMLGEELSYYNELLESYKKNCKSTTLEIESRKLNLEIDVYSTEQCGGFAEHYYYVNGDEIKNEEVEYREIYIADFDSKKDAEEEEGIEITDEEWENEDYVVRGGFRDYTWFEN